MHVPSLCHGFLRSVERFPDRPALAIDGAELSYSELAARAAGLAAACDPTGDGPLLTGLLAARSVPAYAGMLGILLRGHGYVPLNPRYPVARLAYMLGNSGVEQIIVDRGSEALLSSLLDAAPSPLSVVLADRAEVGDDLIGRHPRHRFRTGAAPAELSGSAIGSGDAVAYLLYTSGSTGWPKGVAVSHANVAHFLDVVSERFRLSETDRFSQMFDLSFDLSVFDTFGAWHVGGCVCCPAEGDLLLPADYIGRAGLTVWFSVPSVAVLLNRLRKLAPGAFPGLRLSLFCGEALTAETAAAWARAASGSVVENLYGPTEATLACTAYRWRGTEPERGNVPIGWPFPGLAAKVVDADLAEVAPGAEGELMISGPQVAIGYLKDPDKTAAAFVTDPATGARSYRTGDLVRRPVSEDEPLLFLGRLDHQVKLHGHRVELGEIEAVLRDAAGAPHALVLGWPVTEEGIGGLAGFIEAEGVDMAEVLAHAQRRLPPHMVPKTLRAVSRFPLTPNGKIDRSALVAMLSE